MQNRPLIRALNPCLRESALSTSCSGTTMQIQESVDPLCTAAVEEIGIASAPNRTVRIDVFWAGEVKSKKGVFLKMLALKKTCQPTLSEVK